MVSTIRCRFEVWESRGGDDVRISRRPVAVICDKEADISDLAREIESRFSKVHPTEYPLKINHLEVEPLGMVEAEDQVKEYIHEGELVKAFREPPPASEPQPVNNFRFASVAPGSTAYRPSAKRGRESGRPLPPLFNSSSKKQKLVHDDSERLATSIERDENGIPGGSQQCEVFMVVDSQSTPSRRRDDVNTSSRSIANRSVGNNSTRPTSISPTPKTESPDPEHAQSTILTIPSSSRNSPQSWYSGQSPQLVRTSQTHEEAAVDNRGSMHLTERSPSYREVVEASSSQGRRSHSNHAMVQCMSTGNPSRDKSTGVDSQSMVFPIGGQSSVREATEEHATHSAGLPYQVPGRSVVRSQSREHAAGNSKVQSMQPPLGRTASLQASSSIGNQPQEKSTTRDVPPLASQPAQLGLPASLDRSNSRKGINVGRVRPDIFEIDSLQGNSRWQFPLAKYKAQDIVKPSIENREVIGVAGTPQPPNSSLEETLRSQITQNANNESGLREKSQSGVYAAANDAIAIMDVDIMEIDSISQPTDTTSRKAIASKTVPMKKSLQKIQQQEAEAAAAPESQTSSVGKREGMLQRAVRAKESEMSSQSSETNSQTTRLSTARRSNTMKEFAKPKSTKKKTSVLAEHVQGSTEKPTSIKPQSTKRKAGANLAPAGKLAADIIAEQQKILGSSIREPGFGSNPIPQPNSGTKLEPSASAPLRKTSGIPTPGVTSLDNVNKDQDSSSQTLDSANSTPLGVRASQNTNPSPSRTTGPRSSLKSGRSVAVTQQSPEPVVSKRQITRPTNSSKVNVGLSTTRNPATVSNGKPAADKKPTSYIDSLYQIAVEQLAKHNASPRTTADPTNGKNTSFGPKDIASRPVTVAGKSVAPGIKTKTTKSIPPAKLGHVSTSSSTTERSIDPEGPRSGKEDQLLTCHKPTQVTDTVCVKPSESKDVDMVHADQEQTLKLPEVRKIMRSDSILSNFGLMEDRGNPSRSGSVPDSRRSPAKQVVSEEEEELSDEVESSESEDELASDGEDSEKENTVTQQISNSTTSKPTKDDSGGSESDTDSSEDSDDSQESDDGITLPAPKPTENVPSVSQTITQSHTDPASEQLQRENTQSFASSPLLLKSALESSAGVNSSQTAVKAPSANAPCSSAINTPRTTIKELSVTAPNPVSKAVSKISRENSSSTSKVPMSTTPKTVSSSTPKNLLSSPRVTPDIATKAKSSLAKVVPKAVPLTTPKHGFSTAKTTKVILKPTGGSEKYSSPFRTGQDYLSGQEFISGATSLDKNKLKNNKTKANITIKETIVLSDSDSGSEYSGTSEDDDGDDDESSMMKKKKSSNGGKRMANLFGKMQHQRRMLNDRGLRPI